MHGGGGSMGHQEGQQGQLELMDLLRAHTDQYAGHVKDSFRAMLAVWGDLEVGEDQQREELCAVISDASGRWAAAVEGLRGRRQGVRDSIQDALGRIMAIKEELGADNPGADAELHKLQGTRSAHRTLRAWQQDVLTKASYWEQQRKQRLADYEDLQARIKVLRQLCGLAPQPPLLEQPDISRSNMERLRLELERLATEKERREDLLRALLDELRALCEVLGEDVRAAVAEVHEALVCLWDAEATKVLRDVYRLGSSYSSAPAGAAVDLSDATISALSSKLTIMKDLRASRDAHASEVLAVLHSLWDATEVPDAERAHFVRVMSGPLRLHASSLEKCMAEVRRLEDVRYQQMVDLVLAKGEELAALCSLTHVEQPAGLGGALAAIHAEDRNPGAAAELLAKLLAMLAEVQVLASKRSTIIAAVNEVEAAREEELWLAAYEADDQRYKGRDANKRLQRAIRAGKLRDKLPGMIDDLRRLLAEWKDCEGEAFLFDGRDYEFEVLDGLAAAVEEAAAARAAKAAAAASKRRQSLAGGTAGLPSSPQGAPSSAASAGATSATGGGGARLATPRKAAAGAGGVMPPTPGGGRARAAPLGGATASPAPRPRTGCGAAGAATASGLLRGVSSRSLSERHSICVVRDRELEGPAALSRSGEVRLRPTSAVGGSSSSSSRGATTTASGARSGAAAAGAALGRRGSSEGTSSAAAGGSSSASPASTASSSGLTTPPQRRSSSGGGQDVAPVSSGSGGGARITPPARTPTIVAAAGSSCSGGGARSGGGSVKRPNTSSKLDSIFRRGSVQHPVATLLAAEPSGLHTDSAGAADQDV